MLKVSAPQDKSAPRQQDLPPEFLAQVLGRTDIVELVGRSVALRRHGDNHVGLCPFHGEKSPSFTVSQPKQFFHCFGCGANGNAIHFLREHAGLPFHEAVQELAQAAGVAMPNAEPASQLAPNVHALIKANELAAAFYRHCLRYDETAQLYLKGRGIPSEAKDRFVIGFAPQGWTSLKEAFEDYQTSQHIVDAGLVIHRDDKRYDRFRDRITFGIRDYRGRLLGFGGRTTGSEEPKYLNSPASPIFDKGATLFGAFEAREEVRRTRQVIVVEGYMDVVALSMHGLANCVATMGTACTRRHIERLVVMGNDIVFAFDGDAAGCNAAWKTLLLCLEFASDECSFRFLTLPAGQDPDETILAEGAKSFRSRVEQATPLSEYLLQELGRQNNDLATTEHRARFAKQGQDLLKHLPSRGNLRRLMRERILRASEVPAQSVTALELSMRSSKPTSGALRRHSLWECLTQAVMACPEVAAQHAGSMIESLPRPLQDSFFLERWADFPEQHARFWSELFAALHLFDSKSAIAKPEMHPDACVVSAHRDLLGAAKHLIGEQLMTERRTSLRSAFRAGSISEDEYLQSVSQSRPKNS